MVRTMALYLYALGLVLPPVAASEDCCCSRFRGEPRCGRSRRSRGPHEAERSFVPLMKRPDIVGTFERRGIGRVLETDQASHRVD